MIDSTQATELLMGLRSSSLLRSLEFVPKTSLSELWAKKKRLVAAVKCIACIEENDIHIRVGLKSAFPLELPHIFLINPTEHGLLPHVEHENGLICYQSDEGLSVKTRDYMAILHHSVELAVQEIADGVPTG